MGNHMHLNPIIWEAILWGNRGWFCQYERVWISMEINGFACKVQCCWGESLGPFSGAFLFSGTIDGKRTWIGKLSWIKIKKSRRKNRRWDKWSIYECAFYALNLNSIIAAQPRSPQLNLQRSKITKKHIKSLNDQIWIHNKFVWSFVNSIKENRS